MERDFDLSSSKNQTDLITLQSQYFFKVVGSDTKSCDLSSMNFKAKTKNRTGLVFNKSFGLNECLDLFVANMPADDMKNISDPFKLESFVKSECSFGVRYSAEAKNALHLRH